MITLDDLPDLWGQWFYLTVKLPTGGIVTSEAMQLVKHKVGRTAIWLEFDNGRNVLPYKWSSILAMTPEKPAGVK